MGHTIEAAKSGRAGCRKCKGKIAKGELRFGHEVPNAFDDGELTHQWYHLRCAAEKLPVELESTLASTDEDVPEKDTLRQLIEENRKKVKPSVFPYAELAPSGRSSCLVCDGKIAKGEFRVAVEREVDAGGFARKSAGYLHLLCAPEHDEISDELLDQLSANSTSLDAGQLTQIATLLEEKL